MVGKIGNMATYYKIARMTQNLNRFIREATVTKSQINNSYMISLSKLSGIGNKIDLYA